MKYRYLYFVCLAFVFLTCVMHGDVSTASFCTTGTFPLHQNITAGKSPVNQDLADEYILSSGKIEKLEAKSYGDYYIYLSSLAFVNKADGTFLDASKSPKGIVCITKSEEIFNELKAGYSITVSGKFTLFDAATNPGQFDARTYYQTLGMEGRITNVKIIDVDDSPSLESFLYDFKCIIKNKIMKMWDSPTNGIIATLLIGDKESLPDEIKELFRNAGISHILSISSLHITMIGMGLFSLLKKTGISHKVAAGFSGIVILLYCIAIDGSISARRAVFMFSLHMLAVILGRTYDPRTALGLSVATALIQEPLLINNAGFWLSYGCVLSAFMASDSRDARGRFHRIILMHGDVSIASRKIAVGNIINDFLMKIEESVKISVYIMLGTMPILLWFYYEISFWGILINIIAIPCITVCLACAFASVAIPFWMRIAGVLFPLVSRIMLETIAALCKPINTFNIGCICIGKPAAWMMIFYYLCLLVWVTPFGIHISKHEKNVIFMRIRKWIMVLPIFVLLFFSGNNGEKVTFLDVGQGDSIVVQNGGNRAYLIDGGSSSSMSVGKYVILPYLKHEGVRNVEAVFLSHPDADHVNGIIGLLEETNQVHVKKIVIASNTYDIWKEKYPELFELCDKKGIAICNVEKGYQIKDKNMLFSCLHPNGDTRVSSKNEDSEVLLLQAKGLSFLFTGDLEADGETAVTRTLEKVLKSDVSVLKVAHHGSKNSTSTRFLQATNPRLAVISVGANNRYGHPSSETLERLEKQNIVILRTDKLGAIEINIK